MPKWHVVKVRTICPPQLAKLRALFLLCITVAACGTMHEATLVLLVALVASFSPAVAVAGATVPTINFLLNGNLADLTESEQEALMDGVIDTLQAVVTGSESECGHGTFDRSFIAVWLSEVNPIRARVYFKPGSGVDLLSEARDIVDCITSDGKLGTGGGKRPT